MFVIQDISKIMYQKCFLKRPGQIIIQFSEAEVAGNFDITPTSIHVQKDLLDTFMIGVY